ncbi:MAG TPA: thioredoxin domain-containing protein [Rhizomicrobium sp.]|jgi:protein-disulfide isomerase|nr:thioredoxin domain-containing protein [Rhizomicrobium sp.]
MLDRRHLLTAGVAAVLTPSIAARATATAPAADEPFIGRRDAPVAMTVWFDFQCPYCKILWQQTIPKLNDAYVRSGQLRLVFRDFSFLGKDSLTAAVVGRAVWHAFPRAYYAWTTAMFNAQDGENGGFGDEISVERLTVTVPGIEATALAKNFNANVKRYIAEVQADFAVGERSGVRGTPAVAIGGRLMTGAVSFDDIAARIAAELGNRL